jgi:hypothetical protein
MSGASYTCPTCRVIYANGYQGCCQTSTGPTDERAADPGALVAEARGPLQQNVVTLKVDAVTAGALQPGEWQSVMVRYAQAVDERDNLIDRLANALETAQKDLATSCEGITAYTEALAAARAENAAYLRELSDITTDLCDAGMDVQEGTASEQIRRVLAGNAALRDGLRSLERLKEDGDDWTYCAVCKNWMTGHPNAGHDEDCALVPLLARLEPIRER